MGFRLHLKLGGFLAQQSPLSPPSSSSCSYSICRGRESSSLTRLPGALVLYGEAEALNEIYRTHVSSFSPQLLENCFLKSREVKVPIVKGSGVGLHGLLHDKTQTSYHEDGLAYLTILQATNASHFRLLMKNLDMLEGMCADSNAVRLERDILEQLERLGALRLFHSCLSRTLKFSSAPTEPVEEPTKNNSIDKVIVRSGKKELRKLRKNAPPNESHTPTQDGPLRPTSTSARKSGNKRHKIARNEAEMSSGVKMVAGLEKIKTVLEEETGRVISLSSWAEAAGIKNKELHQHLHYGWHCRDELLRSTRSLVLFIARNYRGLGIAFEDLIQAGNVGVLLGAERFDQSRGYKFSTYVQYWIRKSISTLVAKHARGIRIPSTLSKAINQVQKARKALSATHGKFPDDGEIAKYTGLSVAKITSASKCLRVVGSIDQNVWDGINIKYREITADTSMPSPKKSVIRQHMVKDVYALLDGMEPREKQVIVLRFGLGNQQCKSLEEIGRHFCVSKEWIRKIERTALRKLRDENSVKMLRHYVHLQQ